MSDESKSVTRRDFLIAFGDVIFVAPAVVALTGCANTTARSDAGTARRDSQTADRNPFTVPDASKDAAAEDAWQFPDAPRYDVKTDLPRPDKGKDKGLDASSEAAVDAASEADMALDAGSEAGADAAVKVDAKPKLDAQKQDAAKLDAAKPDAGVKVDAKPKPDAAKPDAAKADAALAADSEAGP